MAEISAKAVKDLKDLTNCGLMDCKRALQETDGDVQEAVKYLREKGLAKAAKKSGRIAAEGLVVTKVVGNTGVIVEVNCETDFAARTERFIEFSAQVIDTVAASSAADVEALKDETLAGTGEKLSEALPERIATIGENINIRRFAKLAGEHAYEYVHNNGGSIVGVLLAADGDDNPEVAKNLMLQLAAYGNTQFMSTDDIDPKVLETEKEIQTKIALEENAASAKPKPEQVIHNNIIPGRLKKYAAEIALLSQEYFKDSSVTVGEYVKKTAPNFKPVKFVRFELGEGIEKKEENFAEEVAKAIGN